jgi:hypothetical protein
MGQHRNGHRHRGADHDSSVLHHEGKVHTEAGVLHHGMNSSPLTISLV